MKHRHDTVKRIAIFFVCLVFSPFALYGQEAGLVWSSVGETRAKVGQGSTTVDFAGASPWKWLQADVRPSLKLSGARYIEFDFRTLDGLPRLFEFTFERELQGVGKTVFTSYFTASKSWSRIRLPLVEGQVSASRQGKSFYIRRGVHPNLRLEDGGGVLRWFLLGCMDKVSVEFKNFGLSSEELPDEAVASLIERACSQPVVQPYRFRELLPGPSVPAGEFVIVAPETTTDTMAFAAQELSSYLGQVLGHPLPVVSRAEAGDRQIHLSVCPGKPSDGFRSSMTDGRVLRIEGNSERGLLYGVYDFLEIAAGCRWFMPFEYGQIISREPALRFRNFRHWDAPSILVRRAHYCSHHRAKGFQRHIFEMADWCVKNRINRELENLRSGVRGAIALKKRDETIGRFYARRGGIIPETTLPGGGFFHAFIPPEKYFADHPDYFCYDKSLGAWRCDRTQICTTNPDVIKIISNAAKAYFRQHPDQMFFNIWQEDGSRLWCQCPRCLALTPTGRTVSSATEANIYLGNAVKKELEGEFPDKQVMVFAYSVTEVPSQRVRPIPGVWVMFCNSGNYRDLMEWSRQTQGRMMVYTYNYLNPWYYMFEPLEKFQEKFRVLASLGVQGVNMETSQSWYGVDGLRLYLSTRQAWNPYWDTKALIADYFERLYGAKAAPIMRTYCQWLEREFKNPRNLVASGHGNDRIFALAASDLQWCLKQITRAEEASGRDPRIMRLLASERLYLHYLKLQSDYAELRRKFSAGPDEQQYQVIVNKMDEICHFVMDNMDKCIVPLFLTYHNYYNQFVRDGLWQEVQNEKARRQLGVDYEKVRALNQWKFKVDESGKGDDEACTRENASAGEWRPLVSGKFWDAQGVSHCGYAWYRMELDLDPKADYALYFEAVDERAWVYVNGQLAGSHADGDVMKLWKESFVVPLPRASLKAGKNLLAVKVHNARAAGGIYRNVWLLKKKH